MKKHLLLLPALALVVSACALPGTDTESQNDGSANTHEDGTVQKDDTHMNGDKMMKDGGSMEKMEVPESGTEYMVSTSDSTVNYVGTGVGKTHEGVVPLQSGSIVLDENEALVGAMFVLDMANLTSDGAGVEAHLKEDDFFGVANYPTAMLKVTEATETAAGEYNLTGMLTIRDVTNEISFPATVTQTEDNITASASFSIDRTEWGITFGSGNFFEDLGDSLIEDDIDFEVTLVAATQ